MIIYYYYFFPCQIPTFAPEAEKAAGLRQRDGGPPEGKQLPSSCFLPLDRPTANSAKRKFLYTVFSWLVVKGRSGTLSAGLKIKSVKPPGIQFFLGGGGLRAAGKFFHSAKFPGTLTLVF